MKYAKSFYFLSDLWNYSSETIKKNDRTQHV